MVKLTKRSIDLAYPRKQDWFLWDDGLTGFGLRILPSGVKSYIVQYRTPEGRTRRIAFAKSTVLTPDQARDKAQMILAEVADQKDPSAERKLRRAMPDISALCDRFLDEHVDRRNKVSTSKEYKRLIEKWIRPKLGHLKIAADIHSDVNAMHVAMEDTPRQANQALAVASKLFSLAEDWRLRPSNSNPCRGIARFPETRRERFMTDEELVTVGLQLEIAVTQHGEAPGAILAIQLLALTGCRVGEILALVWSDVQLESGLLVIQDAKAGPRDHIIGDASIALLRQHREQANLKDGDPVIAGPRGGAMRVDRLDAIWARIRGRCGLDDVRLHDLRHTVATYSSQTGANAFLIRDKLGHKTMAMTGRYVGRAVSPLRGLSNAVEDRIGGALGIVEKQSVVENDETFPQKPDRASAREYVTTKQRVIAKKVATREKRDQSGDAE